MKGGAGSDEPVAAPVAETAPVAEAAPVTSSSTDQYRWHRKGIYSHTDYKAEGKIYKSYKNAMDAIYEKWTSIPGNDPTKDEGRAALSGAYEEKITVRYHFINPSFIIETKLSEAPPDGVEDE